jgi:hypothetical protein
MGLYYVYGTGKENHQLGTGSFVQHRIVSAIKRAEFDSDRMSYIVLRGRWFNITVLNAHAPTEENSDVSKERFYVKLEPVLDRFSKYHMQILLGEFKAKLGKKNIYKPTIWNESIHQDSNDNGKGIVIFAT